MHLHLSYVRILTRVFLTVAAIAFVVDAGQAEPVVMSEPPYMVVEHLVKVTTAKETQFEIRVFYPTIICDAEHPESGCWLVNEPLDGAQVTIKDPDGIIIPLVDDVTNSDGELDEIPKFTIDKDGLMNINVSRTGYTDYKTKIKVCSGEADVLIMDAHYDNGRLPSFDGNHSGGHFDGFWPDLPSWPEPFEYPDDHIAAIERFFTHDYPEYCRGPYFLVDHWPIEGEFGDLGPRKGMLNTIEVLVENKGSAIANCDVTFYVHTGECIFGVEHTAWEQLDGVFDVTILPGGNEWVSKTHWLPSGDGPWVLVAKADCVEDPVLPEYSFDAHYENNIGVRGTDVDPLNCVGFLEERSLSYQFSKTYRLRNPDPVLHADVYLHLYPRRWPAEMTYELICQSPPCTDFVQLNDSIYVFQNVGPEEEKAINLAVSSPAGEKSGTMHIAATISDSLIGALTVYVTPSECPLIKIEKTHHTMQGTYEYVSITTDGAIYDMGGFDFLIGYDASALTFTEATPGQLLEDCGWEYFTYRYGVHGNCGDACPSGLLRIIALAESNDGANHPNCYGPPDCDPHELAKMKFYVTNDRTFEGQYVPVYFFWDDCGDNSISSIYGDYLLVDRAVFEFNGTVVWDEDDDILFPEDARIPFVGAPDSCLVSEVGKPNARRCLSFVNGGIDIIPADSIDDPCDLNLNGVAYEIADAVVFVNCLMGIGICPPGVIAASDCNKDGHVMTVADLVYLIRVILGLATPFPKVPVVAPEASANLLVNSSVATMSVESVSDIGAGYFIFDYSGYTVGEPHLINGASDMTLEYGDDGGTLRVIVYSMEEDRKIPAGTENIFVIPIEGRGSLYLTEIQLSDYYGNLMRISDEKKPMMPTDFALHQNYPNPFNAVTQIIYELPQASHVKIEVRNIMGQEVATLIDKAEEAGIHRIEWNGTDQSGLEVASGIYFYRLEAEDFVETRKMTLLK